MMMHRRAARLAALLSAGVLALAITAPVSAAEPLRLVWTVNDATVPTAGQSALRILHAAPDGPQFDIYVGADLASAAHVGPLSGLLFAAISGYEEFAPGTYAVKVCARTPTSSALPSGPPDFGDCPVEIEALDLSADTKYTAAVSGPWASPDWNVFVDDPDPAETIQSMLRAVHLSSGTPAVDFVTAGDSIGIVGLAYPNRLPTSGYAKIAPGMHKGVICAASDSTVCPGPWASFDLAAGTAYSIFVVGSANALTDSGPSAPPTDLIATTDSGSTERGIFTALVIIGLAGIGTFAITRRLTTRRVER